MLQREKNSKTQHHGRGARKKWSTLCNLKSAREKNQKKSSVALAPHWRAHTFFWNVILEKETMQNELEFTIQVGQTLDVCEQHGLDREVVATALLQLYNDHQLNDALIPYGKFKGKSVKFIAETEAWWVQSQLKWYDEVPDAGRKFKRLRTELEAAMSFCKARENGAGRIESGTQDV